MRGVHLHVGGRWSTVGWGFCSAVAVPIELNSAAQVEFRWCGVRAAFARHSSSSQCESHRCAVVVVWLCLFRERVFLIGPRRVVGRLFFRDMLSVHAGLFSPSNIHGALQRVVQLSHFEARSACSLPDDRGAEGTRACG